MGMGLFGGSKQKSQSQSKSYNEAFPMLQQAYGGQTQTGVGANDAVAALLGLKGPQANNEGFQNYLNSSGYNFMMDQGSRAITGNAAAKGLLQSGSTAKRLTEFGQGLGSQYFNSYLDRLLGLSGQGLQAGQLLASAGARSEGTSTQSSKSKPGLGGLIGGLATGIAGV